MSATVYGYPEFPFLWPIKAKFTENYYIFNQEKNSTLAFFKLPFEEHKFY